MKVVVTGGCGFIGSHLVEELAKEYEVIVIDDLSTGRIENLENLTNANVRFIKGSVTDLRLLKDVFKNAECVFHQAAIPSVQRSLENLARRMKLT